jgi:cell division protein FtsL
MSAIAETVRAEAPKRKPKAAARRRTVTGGVLWIVVLGALLAGVVAVNVVVLQLNVRLDELNHQRGELKAENARLRSRISTAAANVRIDREAREGLGLVPAEIGTTKYVELRP